MKNSVVNTNVKIRPVFYCWRETEVRECFFGMYLDIALGFDGAVVHILKQCIRIVYNVETSEGNVFLYP